MAEIFPEIARFLDSIFAYGAFWIYLVIFAACFVENLFPPFPGDTFIAVAGSLVGLSRLDLAPSFVVVVLGGSASVMLLYYLGDRFGRRYFLRKDFRYFSADDIHDMERQFQKWGGVLMILSRFIVGFRSALALAAGIGEYHPVKMFVYTIVSYMLFAGLIFYASITFVDNFERIHYYFRTYGTIAWPLLILLAGLYVGHIIYKHVRRG